jgi:hypothetical protein
MCNADKIGLPGFVCFTVLTSCRYVSLLAIDAGFIEKQVLMGNLTTKILFNKRPIALKKLEFHNAATTSPIPKSRQFHT